MNFAAALSFATAIPLAIARVHHHTVLDRVQDWIGRGGYYVLFALLFSCGLGVPLPEDVPLILAGYFIAIGKMHLAIAAVVAWCGIIGGDLVLYHLGKKFGLEITRLPLIGKHVTRQRIEWVEHKFEKWGIWVVAVGRLFAGVRGAMVVASGAIRYNLIKFVIADGLAAVVSGGLFMGLGYWAGKKLGDLNHLREIIKHYEDRILIGAIVAAVIFVIYLWWRRRHEPVSEVLLDKAEKVVTHPRPKDAPAAAPPHHPSADNETADEEVTSSATKAAEVPASQTPVDSESRRS